MTDETLLPPNVLRLISDKLYEKRKLAALEIEQLVKKLSAAGDHGRVRLLVDKLVSEYAFAVQPNHRKGALLCLAAAAVGLGNPTPEQLRLIVPPVLASFKDTDARVRYYACEALYNVAKVARESFLLFFNEVFEALFKLCADPEPNVQNAVTFLDNLVKDIVAASPSSFNMPAFVPRLRALLCAPASSPRCRAFLISWVAVLDSVPDLDLLPHLPALLEGLLGCLGDGAREIRVSAHKALMELLAEVRAHPCLDFPPVAATLVGAASSGDDLTRLTALRWLQELLDLVPGQLVAVLPAALAAVLANMNTPNPDIAQASRLTSNALIAAATATASAAADASTGVPPLDTGAMVAAASAELLGTGTTPTALLPPYLGGGGAATDPDAPPPAYAAVGSSISATPKGASGGELGRLEALRWVSWLLGRSQEAVLGRLPALLPALLDALMAESEAVAEGALGVFAAIAACPGRFRPALTQLMGRFKGEAGGALLQRGGALVVRRLCSALGPRAVYCELAGALAGESDCRFAATMVQALNLILLTSPEVRELREALRGAAAPSPPPGQPSPAPAAAGGGDNSDGAALFVALYPGWSHSTGALLSLCLLAQAYEHAYEVVQCYSWLPIGSEVLVQLDRLIHLLDSPPFTPLRLQLLHPRQHPALQQAMYALLALLPQSNAFRLLSTRLQSVPTQALLALQDLDLGQGRGQGVAAAAAAVAVSAPPMPPPTHPMPRAGSGEAGVGATGDLVGWGDVDWGGLLAQFCARQQRHYAVEIGDEAQGGEQEGASPAAAAGSGTSAATLSSRPSQQGVGASTGAGGVAPASSATSLALHSEGSRQLLDSVASGVCDGGAVGVEGAAGGAGGPQGLPVEQGFPRHSDPGDNVE